MTFELYTVFLTFYHLFRNVVIHVGTAWLAAWPLISMGTWILPYFIHISLIIGKLLICLVQDVKLGVSIKIVEY